jgi:hypothetical protein
LTDAVPVPSGRNGAAAATSLPSGDPICGINFSQGIANQVIIQRPGHDYYYKNPYDNDNVFPSIYIPGYRGTPVPVIDCEYGELVAILTSCTSFNPNTPSPAVSILPNDSSIGIKTCDPNYDIVLGGFFILNTGFNYCDPEILIYDKDREDFNGKAKVTIVDGRIVDYEIVDSGTGFMRLPRIDIIDTGKPCGTQGGFGAKILPIMSVIPKPLAKPLPDTINMIYCPAKNQVNVVEPTSPQDLLAASIAAQTPTSTTVPDEGVQPEQVINNVTSTTQSAAQARLAEAQATVASQTVTSINTGTSSGTTSTSTGSTTSDSGTTQEQSSSQQQSSGGYGGY